MRKRLVATTQDRFLAQIPQHSKEEEKKPDNQDFTLLNAELQFSKLVL
jgi:hypothetical protein